MKRTIIKILLIIFVLIISGCATKHKAQKNNEKQKLTISESRKLWEEKYFNSHKYKRQYKRVYKKFMKDFENK